MRRHRSSSRSARLTVCAVIVASLAGSERTQAQLQRGTADSLPRELVEALLRPYIGLYSSSGSKFVVGKMPESLAPYVFVPASARLLGGIEAPTTRVVVLTVPMTYEEVRIAYQREQPKLGWEQPPSFEAMRGWGFMPAPGTMSGGSGLDFCHIGQSLEIRVTTETPTTSQVTATVQNFGGRCNIDARAGGRPPAPAELPTLTNPPGSAMNSPTCTQSGPFFPSGSGGTSERLQTSLTPQQLLETFARQLSDSGWTTGETTTTIRRSWTRPESTSGFVRELTVTAGPILSSPGCHEVTMTLRRVLKR